MFRIWDRASTALGSTKIVCETPVQMSQFQQGKGLVESVIALTPCQLTIAYEFTTEQVGRTCIVNNLKPGTEDSHMKELFNFAPGGVKQTYIDKAKNVAMVEFNTRPGYVSAFQMNGQHGLTLTPSSVSIEQEKSPMAAAAAQAKNDPVAAAKNLFSSVTGSLFGAKKQ